VEISGVNSPYNIMTLPPTYDRELLSLNMIVFELNCLWNNLFGCGKFHNHKAKNGCFSQGNAFGLFKGIVEFSFQESFVMFKGCVV
jgi:hypothetical protein